MDDSSEKTAVTKNPLANARGVELLVQSGVGCLLEEMATFLPPRKSHGQRTFSVKLTGPAGVCEKLEKMELLTT